MCYYIDVTFLGRTDVKKKGIILVVAVVIVSPFLSSSGRMLCRTARRLYLLEVCVCVYIYIVFSITIDLTFLYIIQEFQVCSLCMCFHPFLNDGPLTVQTTAGLANRSVWCVVRVRDPAPADKM